MRKVSNIDFEKEPGRYIIRNASDRGNPLCPVNGRASWLGFDLKKNEFVDLPVKVFDQLLQYKKQD